ncbi:MULTISPECIES: hypothetical protein [unclassified Haladaptatus]|uniref:hypothetical protein n=1 Tax=unclassified Haladaptatus TaxID=2622732 RepID=UPI00209BECCD|nr:MULTISPECIES: hypothetical protein [unclassified Haladaptatus]MCO8246770.1 hypothetical protein [Haladaptatus sp. AB643]MCO8256418.1 hypothetical protein [Haladaptatus sp. AB618]
MEQAETNPEDRQGPPTRCGRSGRTGSPARRGPSGRNGPPRFVVFALGVALGVFASRRLELDSGGD